MKTRALVLCEDSWHPAETVRHGLEALNDSPINFEFLAAGTVRDEHYFVETNQDMEIFLLSRSKHGVQPAGWTRVVDGGRVCVLTPGHNLEVWLQPSFQKLLLNALRWVAKLN